MLKKLLKLKNGKLLDVKYPIRLFDSNGNKVYYEDSNGFWTKREYDSSGNETYYEDSDNFWYKSEYDTNGNETYYENSNNYWTKSEFDSNSNETYYENSNGTIRGNSKCKVKQKIKELEAKLEELKKEIGC